jgi:hypothetical protein
MTLFRCGNRVHASCTARGARQHHQSGRIVDSALFGLLECWGLSIDKVRGTTPLDSVIRLGVSSVAHVRISYHSLQRTASARFFGVQTLEDVMAIARFGTARDQAIGSLCM